MRCDGMEWNERAWDDFFGMNLDKIGWTSMSKDEMRWF